MNVYVDVHTCVCIMHTNITKASTQLKKRVFKKVYSEVFWFDSFTDSTNNLIGRQENANDKQ